MKKIVLITMLSILSLNSFADNRKGGNVNQHMTEYKNDTVITVYSKEQAKRLNFQFATENNKK